MSESLHAKNNANIMFELLTTTCTKHLTNLAKFDAKHLVSEE